MTKSILSLIAIVIISLAAIIQVNTNVAVGRPSLKSFRLHWLVDSNGDRNELIEKGFENKRVSSPESRPRLSALDDLHSNSQFKGVY